MIEGYTNVSIIENQVSEQVKNHKTYTPKKGNFL